MWVVNDHVFLLQQQAHRCGRCSLGDKCVFHLHLLHLIDAVSGRLNRDNRSISSSDVILLLHTSQHEKSSVWVHQVSRTFPSPSLPVPSHLLKLLSSCLPAGVSARTKLFVWNISSVSVLTARRRRRGRRRERAGSVSWMSRYANNKQSCQNWKQILWIRTLLSLILWWNKLTMYMKKLNLEQLQWHVESDISHRCRQSSTINHKHAEPRFCSADEQHNRSTWCENDVSVCLSEGPSPLSISAPQTQNNWVSRPSARHHTLSLWCVQEHLSAADGGWCEVTGSVWSASLSGSWSLLGESKAWQHWLI